MVAVSALVGGVRLALASPGRGDLARARAWHRIGEVDMTPAEHVTVFLLRLIAAACWGSVSGSGWALRFNFAAKCIEERS
jgi:hypothetical protein